MRPHSESSPATEQQTSPAYRRSSRREGRARHRRGGDTPRQSNTSRRRPLVSAPPSLGFQCSLGHFLCLSCRCEILDKKCHLCVVETSFERCFGMEHVVRSVTVLCSNAKYGCTEQVTYYQKEEHEKACPKAPCFCPESGCSFAGPTMALLGHLTAQHKCPFSTSLASGMVNMCLYFEPGLRVLH